MAVRRSRLTSKMKIRIIVCCCLFSSLKLHTHFDQMCGLFKWLLSGFKDQVPVVCKAITLASMLNTAGKVWQ